MTISNIALDAWACGLDLVNWNIILVSIFFCISFTLFIIRIFQIYKQNTYELVAFPEKLLQACHLLAMFFSCLYMFLYVWNYIHMYIDNNVMDCSLWFVLIMISITSTKVFIYAFLMLRSTLSFRNSFFEIPLHISISITLITSISQLTWMALMLYDFSINSLLPFGSLCFRELGPTGTIGIVGFNINDAISASVALLIFWVKAKSVQSILIKLDNKKSDPNDKQMASVSDEDLNYVFNKHIKLGILIALGSILIFLAGEFLSILMGVASTLHQCLNNIYIFLLFRENNDIYRKLCICRCSCVCKHEQTEQMTVSQVKPSKPDDIRSEGVMQHDNDTNVMHMVVDVLREMTQITPRPATDSFFSKSLSSIPRLKSMSNVTKPDKQSQSSNNLKAPMPILASTSKLTLIDAPTLSETPSIANSKRKLYHFNNETLSTPIFPLTPMKSTTNVQRNSNVQHDCNEQITSTELPEIKIKDLSVVYD